MDKLFHVFVSSTYSDLQEERSRVSEGLSKAGQVPEGMEIFPASSQKQIDFIKSVIDRCDYYAVIVGGRYGSTTPDGVSFTELEYEYALWKGLPTLAFLHSRPDQLEGSKTDNDSSKTAKLAKFRERLEQNSLVDYWISADQLATKVVAAIAQEVSTNPGIGWIRGNRAASEDLLNEINELRKTNEELREALRAATPPVMVSNLAKKTEPFTIHYKYKSDYNKFWIDETLTLTWQEILRIVGPQFRSPHNTGGVTSALLQYLKDVVGRSYYDINFSATDKDRILNQLELLGYMTSAVYNLQNGGQSVLYALTPSGISESIRLNAVTSTT